MGVDVMRMIARRISHERRRANDDAGGMEYGTLNAFWSARLQPARHWGCIQMRLSYVNVQGNRIRIE